jgi:murein L,D-transpeptidase YafK
MGLFALKGRRGVRYAGLLALGSLIAQGTGGAHAKSGEHGRQTHRHRVAHAALSPVDSRLAGLAPAEADAQELGQRLAARGLTEGSAVMLRVFKAESELELWLERGDRFELFATYPICFWSGTLGPKLREGDRQAPEGVYGVVRGQLHRAGKRPRSFDIGFPNALDAAAGRSGSNIWIHGGCASAGCYAMTDAVMAEIYTLVERALAQGQDRIQVAVFPFRMTADNMVMHRDSQWLAFWANLREVYDAFESVRVPPIIAMCSGRYVVRQAAASPREPDAVEAPSPPCVPPVGPAIGSAASAKRATLHASRLPRTRHGRRRHAGRSYDS